ncbi:hypothetical protein JHK84_044728 [Glycine max]|nr:hypothetical protein JHK84_044728 [Glycine max]
MGWTKINFSGAKCIWKRRKQLKWGSETIEKKSKLIQKNMIETTDSWQKKEKEKHREHVILIPEKTEGEASSKKAEKSIGDKRHPETGM